jgi:hydroxymethylbilane synthase
MASEGPSGVCVIATRESRLALWQASYVQDLLKQELGLEASLLGMTTRGDQILDRSLAKVGGKGLFVKELEAALAQGQAHLAVHSLKDVPMDLPEGFELAAVLEREDPRDAWVSARYANWRDAPAGTRVGTSSLRRAAQLRALRPDFEILPVRGNLDTRLRKLDEGAFDAIVLAAAGLVRLGLGERIRAHFAVQDMIPCAGQGALGLEVHVRDQVFKSRLQALIHTPSSLAVEAERAVSRSLGGSCSVPLAAHASWDAQAGDTLSLRVALGHTHDASAPLLRASVSALVLDEAQARALGLQAAQCLREQGAEDYLKADPQVETP